MGAAVDRLVGLHADQRADALLLAGAEELDRAVHHAVIGQRQGRLAEALGFLDQVFDAPKAVEQRVFGVDVQMDKVVGHGRQVLNAAQEFAALLYQS